MNVYLSGSHGTGKTSIVKKLRKSGWHKKPSVARSSPFPAGTVRNQHYIMSKVYDNCMRLEGYALDRTPIDVMSYTKLYLPDNKSELMYSIMKVESFRRSNPLIFYTPIEFELDDDGFRPGLEEQEEVDMYIKETLDTYDFYYVMLTGTVEQRVKTIKECISAKV